jgi:hypothetical protein
MLEMKDDNLSDVQKDIITDKAIKIWKDANKELDVQKYSEAINKLNKTTDKELNMSEANCKHGIAMDIFCAQCVGTTRNERLIQQMSVEQISKFAGSSVLVKEVWNAALDSCLAIVDKEIRVSAFNKEMMMHQIRILKK